MTRIALCAALTLLVLALGVLTGLVQSRNRERGRTLDDLRSECLLIEAVNGERAADIVTIDHPPLDPDAFEHPVPVVAR